MNILATKKIQTALDNVRNHGWGILDLKNCGLSEIPKEIFEYENLVNIDLSNDDYCEESMKNIIKVIPENIIKLKKLAYINLSNNKLVTISENISKLTSLQYLNLSNNRLTELSPKIANMSSLKSLNLEGNPFDMLPPEIVARGIESIRFFFKELEEIDYLYEVKLIIVGEGRVGKTSISKALANDDFNLNDEESTEGININSWVIPNHEIIKINEKIQRDFQINIWDFGGQEIYHSTHQFFLTKRSIYLLVTESRKEDSHDDFFYWLNIIKLLGDKSPVLIVLNKCDQPTKELPIKDYKESFSNIVDFRKLSLVNGFENTKTEFKDTLKKLAVNLPHIGNPLPKVWVDIRREIETLKQSGLNYISEKKYLDICKNHYRKSDSALFLSEYFHDLGVILHFQDDLELKDTVFLNHEWITNGVYKILDDRKVIEQKGRFSISDLSRIWSSDEHNQKIRELLSLMKNKKFDLCFELSTGEYLVPRLLPVDEIDNNWSSTSENLKFEYRYKFMPKGILTRLIVKLNEDINDNMYWRFGVFLKYKDSEALIKEKYFENKITIEISGNNKRDYLFHIRKVIDSIHKDFNKLKVDEMVPCVCSQCKELDVPHFYENQVLKRYENKNIKDIRCPISLEEIKVASLITDIINAQLSNDKFIFCENKNHEILNQLNIENHIFYPELNSNNVFYQVRMQPERYGLRDRDFLTDAEIEKLKKDYPNYYILNYYCFENYLFHPDNIEELNLQGFNKNDYISEIIKQKNDKKLSIISIFKQSRSSYQEFKNESDGYRIKNKEDSIIEYLSSDDLEIFFKSFSMKDKFNKSSIDKYGLKEIELAKTKWFRKKISIVLGII